MNCPRFILALVILFFMGTARGAIKEKLISDNIAKKLDDLSTAEKWREFVSKNERLFPKLKKDSESTSVIVQKEELKIDGSAYTLGVGYRQTFIRAPLHKVIKILNSPDLFKALYGLDAPAEVNFISGKVPPEKIKNFKARIYKQVPLIPNQDYILEYMNTESQDLWLQRAKLDKDNENFALRDNLKVLEPLGQGTVFREISMIYALKWYVRFFGPSVREVMTKELGKITEAVKCLAESDKDATPPNAEFCWKLASGETSDPAIAISGDSPQ